MNYKHIPDGTSFLCNQKLYLKLESSRNGPHAVCLSNDETGVTKVFRPEDDVTPINVSHIIDPHTPKIW